MNDQNDDAQNYALMVLAGVVALVVAGVIALAVSTTMGNNGEAAAAVGTSAMTGEMPTMATTGGVSDPDGRIYFELGSDALPAEASEVLVRVADAARAQAGVLVLISGFHDASGDAARNAELAKNRALAVRHALEANGVAPDRCVMDKPIEMTGGADPREARRVELRLR